MVSMGWTTDDGPVRLDQFDGRLDFTIAKTSPGVEYANVGGSDASSFNSAAASNAPSPSSAAGPGIPARKSALASSRVSPVSRVRKPSTSAYPPPGPGAP